MVKRHTVLTIYIRFIKPSVLIKLRSHIQSFISPNNAQPICFRILKLTLFIYLFIYLAGFTMFPHFPAPI